MIARRQDSREVVLKLEREFRERPLTMIAVRMGDDLNVSIFGGDRAHIGAVAVSQPRPSSADPERTTASTSVIALLMHKEADLARAIGHHLASNLDVVVSVACGIHFDGISGQEIIRVAALVNSMAEELVRTLDPDRHGGGADQTGGSIECRAHQTQPTKRSNP